MKILKDLLCFALLNNRRSRWSGVWGKGEGLGGRVGGKESLPCMVDG